MRYLLFFFILGFLKLNAQNSVSNQKTFGGNDYENLNSAIVLDDNSIIAGGYSYSSLSADKTSNGFGYSDYWIVKFDSNLAPVWQKSYGGSLVDELTDMFVLKDKGLLCIGFSNSGISGNKTAINKGGTDLWVIKLDSNGNELWQKTYGGNDEDKTPKVAEDKNGNLYFASYSSSGISGDKTDTSRGNSDFWLIKTDASGNILWEKTYGGNDMDEEPYIAITDSNEIVLSGMSLSGNSGEKSENSSLWDIWVLKLDSLGTIIWDKTLGGDMNERGGKPLISNGKIYIVSTTNSGISGNKVSINKGGYDFWLFCLDMNGNKLWDKSYGGSGDESVAFIRNALNNNEILFGGTSASGISGDKTGARRGGYDCWVVCVDTTGNIIWEETIGGTDWEIFSDASIIDNKLLFAGSSYSGIGGDKTEINRGSLDFWLVELTLSTVGLKESTKSASIKVYPNPAKNFIYFELNDLTSEQLELKIMDITGQMLMVKNLSSVKAKLDVSGFKSGVYLFSIFSDGHAVGNGKIIVK